MKRRAFIAGAVIAPVPVITGAEPDDPHRGWLDTWLDLRSTFNAQPSGEDDLLERQMEHYEELISSTPAKTVDGIAAQFAFAVEFDAVCLATPLTRQLAGTISQGFADIG